MPLRAGLGLDLHWRRCMIGHPGRSPINPDARRLQLLPPGLAILPCPPFISHGRFFLPPSSHSLVDQPALTFSSTNNPVASRPIVFEFLRPRRETFDALQCPAIALDAPLPLSQSPNHDASSAQTPPAACPRLDCAIVSAPAYDAAGRDPRPLDAPAHPSGARLDRRRHALKTATIINPRIPCDIDYPAWSSFGL